MCLSVCEDRAAGGAAPELLKAKVSLCKGPAPEASPVVRTGPVVVLSEGQPRPPASQLLSHRLLAVSRAGWRVLRQP